MTTKLRPQGLDRQRSTSSDASDGSDTDEDQFFDANDGHDEETKKESVSTSTTGSTNTNGPRLVAIVSPPADASVVASTSAPTNGHATPTTSSNNGNGVDAAVSVPLTTNGTTTTDTLSTSTNGVTTSPITISAPSPITTTVVHHTSSTSTSTSISPGASPPAAVSAGAVHLPPPIPPRPARGRSASNLHSNGDSKRAEGEGERRSPSIGGGITIPPATGGIEGRRPSTTPTPPLSASSSSTSIVAPAGVAVPPSAVVPAAVVASPLAAAAAPVAVVARPDMPDAAPGDHHGHGHHHAAALAVGADDVIMVKNLDTGEICAVRDIEKFWPEVGEALRPRGAAAVAATASSNSHEASERRPSTTNVEEVKQKKHQLGFVDKMKKVFAGASGRGSLRTPGDNTVRSKTNHVRQQTLTELRVVQSIVHHTGPIWTFAWSQDGQFLATGGQDSIVRVWAVTGTAAAAEITKREEEKKTAPPTVTVAPSVGSPTPPPSAASAAGSPPAVASPAVHPSVESKLEILTTIPREKGGREIVRAVPYRLYSGHKADVIDLAWSKANFLLSASIDKTVRLWHVSRPKCLCLFQHSDFVTCVAFHPLEDRYFVSGSFDKKLRIWNIPEHRVVEWAQTANIITACCFSPTGNMAVAGLYNGQCVFYQTEGLKYFTQLDARNRSGKNRKGKKVTGLVFAPDGKQLLVTTNDSRLRLYDMDDYSCKMKYKGLTNDELQIRAAFSQDGRYIICGSENQCVYIWEMASPATPAVPVPDKDKKKKSESYEYFKGNATTVTCAQFVPRASIVLTSENADEASRIFQLILASGYNGELKFFENRGRPRDT